MTDPFAISIDVSIREIEERDLAGLREWYGSERDENFRRSYKRHLAGEVVYLVAEANAKPVGHLGVDLTRVRRVAFLWQFGVMPVVQSRGIGSAMVRRAEHAARERGFAVAEIAAETDNPRARALYERLGYTLVGERDGEWILRKDLLATVSA
jgi:ribosomal protein S18 acetylase RimI-like enzyme